MMGLPASPERWRRIESILDQALDLPSGERGALLDEVCAGDPDLRAEVEALLAIDEGPGGFLDAPAGELAADLLEEDGEEGSETDLAGSSLGPYRLLREIGRGGMGTVYEAEDARLGRRVAVKLLPVEYGRDRSAKERFLREARSASALDHPNLCIVHDVGESDGRLFIVLALYEGETLRERLQRGPLPVAEAREVAIQVARGLARAHEAGIIHRDIKAANVMLTRRGEAKILDFGIAKLRGDEASLTRTGASWGTPAYMSPEQARGEPVDARTDVWSLGILLFEMLAGRRPFGGDSVEAVLSSILTREPEPLGRIRPDVPPELARVVARALAKNPAERHANAGEMLADLESGTARPARRRWKAAARGGLAVAILLLLAIAAKWLTKPPPVKVALLVPEVTPQGEEYRSVASEVTEATISTLLSLDGVYPLDPPTWDERRGSEVERQRAAEADEVLASVLDCRESWCRVTFRRLDKPGGAVLATVGTFEVPAGLENAHQLLEGVRAHLRRLYPRRSPRPESPGSEVRPQDYAAYIELERRVDRGEGLGAGELARLDALLRTSPDLLPAYLLAAGIARNLGEMDRALGYVARAQELAPYDPQPLVVRLRVELEQERLDKAAETLARLVELAPADIRGKSAEADLLEARGKLKEARSLYEEIVRRRPTWRHRLALAGLEVSLGETDTALRRLRELLEEQPENRYVREYLAWLESLSGSPEHAAALYEELNRVQPVRVNFTNLGWMRYLLRDYSGAVEAYRRALELEPGHLQTRFNLATALKAQGDVAGARRLYRALAKEIEALPEPALLTRMLYAQCLVRLGQRSEAARLAEGLLGEVPEEAQILHQTAQLYALLGERSEALFFAKRASRKGLAREWFTIPEFDSLEEDPEFRALLDSRPARKTAS
jgi:tetratricopeptide (TPR) repeat protein